MKSPLIEMQNLISMIYIIHGTSTDYLQICMAHYHDLAFSVQVCYRQKNNFVPCDLL